jgi:hypothetical protein
LPTRIRNGGLPCPAEAVRMSVGEISRVVGAISTGLRKGKDSPK